MNINDILPFGHHFWDAASEIAKSEVISLRRHTERLARVTTDQDKLDRLGDMPKSLIRNFFNYPYYEDDEGIARAVAGIESLGLLASSGPKLFEPTVEQCEGLEHTEIRLPVEEYSQPFPVMLIKFPKEYVERTEQIIGMPLANYYTARWFEREQVIYLHGLHTDKSKARGGDDCIYFCTLGQMMEHAMAIGDPRCDRIWRVILNSMLLLMHGGYKSEPSHPEHLKKCRERMRKKPLDSTRREIDTHVYNVRLDREIVVRKTVVREIGESGDDTGRSPSPHWRRGHWAHQRYGPGRKEVKLILRPAVFVLERKFMGNKADMSTQYRM